jgi:uncharacterized protein (TIGR03435 family)
MDMTSRLIIPLCITFVGLRMLAQPADKPLEFEIASVKPADPSVRHPNVTPAGESITIVNVPLRGIILYAYDIRDFQLAGVPGRIGDERYDIIAKTAAADRASVERAAETDDQRRARLARVRERLRSLLSNRFGLRVHVEEKEQTILALRIANGGPKLAEPAAITGRVNFVDGHIQGFGAPISMLATQLSYATGLMVADETGLSGNYDFVLDFAPNETDQRDTRPSIFSAVGELGLRLERAKGPVKTVVIDHVEQPSAN